MLFTFEGIDGSGKSSQISLLEARLRASGRKVLAFREPGGTDISERVRSMLLDPQLDISPTAELLLFSAARAQLVYERIRPALKEGFVVLCDRFFDSTTAYQGAGRGVADPAWIESLHSVATSGLVPARTYLIEVSQETAQKRMGTVVRDRMENADVEFYSRVASCYRDLADREPARIRVVDGEQSVEDVHKQIWSDMSEKLEAGHTPDLAEPTI